MATPTDNVPAPAVLPEGSAYTTDATAGDITFVEKYWHRIPRTIRHAIEGFGFRVGVVLALAWLTTALLQEIGVVDQLQGLMNSQNSPTVRVEIPFRDPLLLDARDGIFFLAMTIVAAATFSPWRPAMLLFGLATSLMFATGFRYTRIERNFFAQMVPFLEGFALEPEEPTFMAVLLAMTLFLVITVFSMSESGRVVRKAYEEKGIPKIVRRHLAFVQTAAVGMLAAGSLALALLLVQFSNLTRTPLEDLTEVMPRVNPVVTLLIMGVSLAVIILLLSWKPAPAARPGSVKDTLLQSLSRQDVAVEDVDDEAAAGENGHKVAGENGGGKEAAG